MRETVKVHRRRARAAFLVVTVMTAGIVVTGAEPSHATTYGPGFYLIAVPPGVTQMTFDLYGAQGSGGNAASTGGLGGRAMATIDVTPGATLQLNVGGAGDNGVHPGYNGGGGHSPLTGGGNGGGKTDLRLNDGTTILLLAGGGGGGGADSVGVVGGNGGPGGAMTTVTGMGGDGTPHGGANGGGGGGGGTDAAGGMGGAGGTGTFSGSNGSDGSAGQGGQGGDGFNFGGGGGGGGIFGGGGGGGGGAGASGNAPGGGGGGGSSFGPVGTTFEIGVRSGDGSAVVSYTTGSTTTTSTMVGASTTTTSVATPAGGCAATPVGATFASLACRLAALTAQTQAESALGSLGSKLLVPLAKATSRTAAAKGQCASGQTKQPKARLKQVVRQLIQYSHRLRSHSARKKVPEAVREPLAQTADGIGADAKKLRSALRCPDDATGT
jgi:hypothetical protein